MKWFEYVDWAIEHPADYSFLTPIADALAARAGRDAGASVDIGALERAVGGSTVKQPVQGGRSLTDRIASGSPLERELAGRLIDGLTNGRRSRT